MPMDFNFTTEPEEHPVYHVLYECTEARNIQEPHHQRKVPPAGDKRQPCLVCLDTVSAWLESLT